MFMKEFGTDRTLILIREKNKEQIGFKIDEE